MHTIKEKLEVARQAHWSMMRDIARATPESLRCMGYSNQSNASALLSYFESASKSMEKLLRDYERANPS